ncbi:MAG TPA: phosphoglycerate kinase [Candidatus Portnoybacteria bacterium]|nr:phosphoglycerate kinase [Candidatus Portnoybacteria bacterium]
MKSIKDITIRNRKIILRAGVNVPLDKESGRILDDSRLKASAKTVNYIFSKKPKMLLVVAHLGRPEGQIVENLSLKILIPAWEKILNRRIILIDRLERIQAINQAGIFDKEAVYLLENIRFWSGEKRNSKSLAENISKGFGVYVNDAFSVSHRNHCSIVQLPKFVKDAVAGLLFEEEYKNLSLARDNPKKPAIAIIGGAKIATKLPVIKNLEKIYDKVLVGGMVANGVLDKKIKFSKKVILPIDFSPAEKEIERLDIGPLTAVAFREEIQKAKTIIWNGPLGKFEDEEASHGTKNIMRAIEESDAFKLIGGGETLEAVKKFGHFNQYNYVSESGGAMLEFLAGKDLPGIKALNN